MAKLYRKNISEPWFSLIAVGCKTIEARLNQGDWKKIKEGDQIDWFNKDMEPVLKREFRTVILKKLIIHFLKIICIMKDYVKHCLL